MTAVACGDSDADRIEGTTPSVTIPATVAGAPMPKTSSGSETTNVTAPSTVASTSSSVLEAELCENGSPASGAFELSTGRLQWVHCSPEQAWRAVLGVTDEVVYMRSVTREETPELIALDASNGAELWRRKFSPPNELGQAQGPLAGGGTLVLTISDGTGDFILGVDAATGAERWRTAATVPVEDAPVIVEAGPTAGTLVITGPDLPTETADVTFSPIANTETMVVVAGHTGLRGLDRTTGDERWTSRVAIEDRSGVSSGRSPAAVTGDMVIVPAHGNLVAIDARTGEELWQGQGVNHPSAGEGFVVGYLSEGPSHMVIVGVDADNGETLWTAPGRPSYGDRWAIGGGIVSVLAPDAGVVGYELATGAAQWRRADLAVVEPQQASGDTVFVLSDAYLSVLSSTDGSTRWEANSPLGSPMMRSLASNTTSLFVSVDTLPPGD